ARVANVVRTFRSAPPGRPEGLHYTRFCTALEGLSPTFSKPAIEARLAISNGELEIRDLEFDVKDKRVTVAGAARSGLAAAELLARRGARVTLSDTRSEAPEAEPLTGLGVQLELGGHQLQTFTSAELVVLSPGVPPDTPAIQAARDRGVPVIAEIELASRWLRGRVIAITGTKGKSTTTALTGRMLEAAGFR